MLTKEEVNKWLNLTENNKLKIHALVDSMDALLADVSALVEAAKTVNDGFDEYWYDLHAEQVKVFQRAIAAVEERMK